MKKMMMGVIAAGAIALGGSCAAYGAISARDAASQNAGVHSAKTFFQFIPQPSIKLALAPNPAVMRSFPNEVPPKSPVIVYLPVYPGATRTGAVTGIGDLGTPMTPDLVDGTAYFQSGSSSASIESWYAHRLKKLGYRQGGSGETSGPGGAGSFFVAFTRADGAVGSPTRTPEIDLGFLKGGKKTRFKLRATYIVVPPRPADSFLPAGAVKVRVAMGKQTRIVTDRRWISGVVALIDRLQTSVGGITSCPEIPGGTEPIHAEFFFANGSTVPVTLGLPCGVRGVTVGRGNAVLRGSVQLDRDMEGLFHSASSP